MLNQLELSLMNTTGISNGDIIGVDETHLGAREKDSPISGILHSILVVKMVTFSVPSNWAAICTTWGSLAIFSTWLSFKQSYEIKSPP